MTKEVTGYPVIDQILESVAPPAAEQWCECKHALYNHGEDDLSTQQCNVNGCDCQGFTPTTTTEHEPAARGEGDEWYVGSRSNSPEGDATIYTVKGNRWVGQVKAKLADQIVTEHNSHTALVEQRDRALRMWADLNHDHGQLQQWAGERLESLAKSLATTVEERNEAREERDRLLEAAKFALSTPGFVRSRDSLQKAVDAIEHERGGGSR